MNLQVDPEALRLGASELRVQRGLFDDVLSGIRFEYANLTDVWTGSTADYVTALWDQLLPQVSIHIDALNRLATALTTAADSFVAQDQQFAERVSAVASSLDLP
ncbi:WXG100 family type VII secretion target [Nocardia sp. NPDC058480]|uniref:WXG100 family type VII secretion target n=1 Tax=unclassified Nocardia TaxID=2637762 RepID=UPI003646324B